MEHSKHQREHWASRLGLILAAIGSAIGLGTLWQFPYLVGDNGGGLFVLIYVGFTLFVGIPLFMGEALLGRRAQRGVVGAFTTLSHKSRNWKMVGWLSVLSPLLILSYYNVVGGWGINYVFLSLAQFYEGKTPQQISDVFDVMHASGSISLLFSLLFSGIMVAMVYQGVQKGIEYWARLMTIGLFIILLGLLIYSMTLEGFPQAVRFVLYPDPAKLKASGVLQALGLSFFTLSLGQGVMITYGSYMKRTENIPRVAFIVAGADILISLLAALMIFPVIFTFGFEPAQQAGLIFKTLPVLFARLPLSLIISTTFFLLFVFAGLTSAIALLEVIVANLMDLYDWTRRRASMVAGLAVVVLGVPCALSGSGVLFKSWPLMYGDSYFGTINSLVGTWILPLAGLFTSIFVGWVIGRKDLEEEFKSGAKMEWLFRPWRFFVRWVVPVAIVVVILQEGGLIDIDKLLS
jgi:neurotransmitter:Na+ symporter, NSS family